MHGHTGYSELSPLFCVQAVPAVATAPVLVLVGAMMMGEAGG